MTVSESGATTVRGISGPVTVRTQSGAIELNRLGGTADVTSGSGSVTIDGVAGALSVATSSSDFTARSLAGSLRVRTSSGAVGAALSGDGDVDVQTGSSAIRLRVLNRSARTIQIDDDALELIVAHGYSLAYGARFLRRVIDERINLPISAHWREGSHFHVRVREADVAVEPAPELLPAADQA